MELPSYTPRCSSESIISPSTRSTTGVLPRLQKASRNTGLGKLWRLKKIKTVFTSCFPSTTSRMEEQNYDYEKNLMSSLSRRRPKTRLNSPNELSCSYLADIEECLNDCDPDVKEEDKLRRFFRLGLGEADPDPGDAHPNFRKWTEVVKSASTGLIPEVSSVSMQSEILKECFEILDAELRERIGLRVRPPAQSSDGRRDQHKARHGRNCQAIPMD